MELWGGGGGGGLSIHTECMGYISLCNGQVPYSVTILGMLGDD